MKIALSIALVFFYWNLPIQTELARKKKMVEFLVEHQQLSKSEDNWNTYKDYFHETLIYKSRSSKAGYAIYLFGANSSHGRIYIALCNPNGIKLLETEDLDKDMHDLLLYLRPLGSSMDTPVLLKLLSKINECYKENKVVYY